MRAVIFAVLAVLVGGVGAAAMFPMSMAADFAAKQTADFKYDVAAGSIWDGKLTNVSFGAQRIGDLEVKADLGALLTGKAAGKLGLVRDGMAGEASLIYPLGGQRVELADLKLTGGVGAVPGLPSAVAAGGGQFRLEIKNVTFADNVCESASGEVWTDALTKVNVEGWVGPELKGPVTCQGGKLVAQASGRAVTGEDVEAQLHISHHLDLELTASVANAQPAAAKALAELGFRPEGDVLVVRQALGS